MGVEDEKEIRSRDMGEFSREWEAPVEVETFSLENKEYREKNKELVEHVEEIKRKVAINPEVKTERLEVIENGIWRMVKSFEGRPGDEAVEKLWDVFKRYGDKDPTAMIKGFGFETLVLSHDLDDKRVIDADAAISVEGESEDEAYQEFVHASKLSENLRFGRLTAPEGGPEFRYDVVTVTEAREKEVENRKRLLDLKRIEAYCQRRLDEGKVTEEEMIKERDEWEQEVIEGKIGPKDVREWQVVRFDQRQIAEMRLETWGIMEKGPVMGKIIRQGFIDTNDRPSGAEPLGFGGYFTMVDKTAIEECRTAEELGEHPFFIYLPQEDSGFSLRKKMDRTKIPYAIFDKGEWVIRNMDKDKYKPELVQAIADLINHRNKQLNERMVVPDGIITQKTEAGMIDNAAGVVEAKCWAKAEVEAVLTYLRPLKTEQVVSIGGKLHLGAVLAHWGRSGEKPPAYIVDLLTMNIEIEKEIEYLKRSGLTHASKNLFAVLRVPSDVTAKQATELQLNFLRFGLRYVQVQRMPYSNKEVEAMSDAVVRSEIIKRKLKEEFNVEGKRITTLSANISLRCKLENVDFERMRAVAGKLQKETERGLSAADGEFYRTNKEIVDDYVSLVEKKSGGNEKKEKAKKPAGKQNDSDRQVPSPKESKNDEKPTSSSTASVDDKKESGKLDPNDIENTTLKRKRKWRR